MAEQFTKEEIRQAFYDLAEEMEKECGDWEKLPDTDADRALRNRIMIEINRKTESTDNE